MLINMSCIMIFLWHRQREGGRDPRRGCWVKLRWGRWVLCLTVQLWTIVHKPKKSLTKPPLLSHQSYASKPVLQGRAQKAARLLILPLSPRPPGMQILKWYARIFAQHSSVIECTNTNTQIQIHKYTNTNTQILKWYARIFAQHSSVVQMICGRQGGLVGCTYYYSTQLQILVGTAQQKVLNHPLSQIILGHSNLE